MVTLQDPGRFHTLVKNEAAKTQILIYSVDLANNPTLDFTDRAQVEAAGTLLKYNQADTNSNSRIASDGVAIYDWFNKDAEVQVGSSVSNSIEVSFMNDDGAMSRYAWDLPIVMYFEVYDPDNNDWLYCPLGVYWWEKPTKTTSLIVSARANDVMAQLGNYNCEDWFNSVTWSGQTPTTLFASVESLGIPGVKVSQTMPVNGNVTINKPSFDPTGKSIRDVIEYLSAICGGHARVNREGILGVTVFKEAVWDDGSTPGGVTYILNGSTVPTNILQDEMAEYTSYRADQVIIMSGQYGFTDGSGATSPNPDNPLYIVNNPFIQQSIAPTVGQSIAALVNDIRDYVPRNITFIGDCAYEAGDIIYVRYDSSSSRGVFPIFQQKLVWRGGPFIVTASCSGREKRSLPGLQKTNEYETQKNIYDLSTVKLKTYIDPTPANYTINPSNYASVPYPSGLGPTNVVAIGMYIWTTVTGPISVMPYGQNATSTWYIIGQSGTQINGVRFRYWYI